MDTLPLVCSMDDLQKGSLTKIKSLDKDITSLGSTTIAENDKALVTYVPQRSSRAKTGKKFVESSKKLKRRLQQITDENATLAKLIHDKNNEIEDLKRSVNSLNDVLESVPIEELRTNSSIASNKILDLSKKNRQLKVELDAKKVLVSKKDIQIQKIERELKTMTEKFQHEDNETKKDQALTELQSKFNVLQQKWFETRNRNVELQEKLKLAGKCLHQEIGDTFDMNKLNSIAAQNTCNWRGRAQQIIHQQQTIADLKARLEMLENMDTKHYPMDTKHYPSQATLDQDQDNSTDRSKEEDRKSRSSRSGKSCINYDRFMPSVRKSEIIHRAKVEELEKSIFSLKGQLDEQRNKTLALKVRNKNLNEEIQKFKIKANQTRTEINTMNLTSMNEQLVLQKYEYETRIETLANEVKILKKALQDAKDHEEELETKFNNANETLINRNAYMAEMEDVIKRLEQDMKAICGDFLFSCRELRKEEFVAILDSLETEKNYLFDQNQTLNVRLNDERSKIDNLVDQLGKQKIRNARLEGKIRDLEKTVETSGEKKKRLQRINDYTQNLSAKGGGSVCSLVFENSQRSSSTSLCGDDKQQLNELKHQLEFANEKVRLLEDRLTYLTNEKLKDAKLFEDAIVNSKNTIVETILSYRGDQCSSNIVRSSKEPNNVVSGEEIGFRENVRST